MGTRGAQPPLRRLVPPLQKFLLAIQKNMYLRLWYLQQCSYEELSEIRLHSVNRRFSMPDTHLVTGLK